MVMAWKSKTSGATSDQPRTTNRPIYEDFQPRIENSEQEAAHIAIFHVPGFVKEQLKITYEDGKIRVQGQRPLSNNKRSRFNQLLPLPENCKESKIHAKFHNGVLTITMPKEVLQKTSNMSPSEKKPPPAEKKTQANINDTTPSKTTDTKETPSTSAPTRKAAVAAEVRAQMDQKKNLPTATNDINAEKISQKTSAAEKKAEKGQEGVPQTVATTADKDDKQRIEKKMGGVLSPQKETVETKKQKDIQEEIIPEQRVIDSEIREVALVDSQKRTREESSLKGREENQKKANENLGKTVKSAKVADRGLEKETESTKEAKELSGPLAGVVNVSKILDDGKEAFQKLVSDTANKEKSKEEDGRSTNENKMGVKYMAETAKQTVTNVVKRLNDDDGQLLINIGAAVLVIVALGAYVTYSYGSSTKHKN
ncbi:inactive protein RESTRICTED TEV MOVEMENT 2 [Humulus lupulus]|uniref:inactive protein RESTRICTED TEV MOVEMENT 2 n=1 Tax=Humulus lupulus TaxID=3486 RepID=UPI002B40077E|nr:inactive protein RESTRICTED TEV MOVEMENT 2 [Humulus lupulus]